MEAADHDRDAGRAKRPRDVHGARKLVRLHADQPDHPEAVVLPDPIDDVVSSDAGVGLVAGRDVELDIAAEHLRSAASRASA